MRRVVQWFAVGGAAFARGLTRPPGAATGTFGAGVRCAAAPGRGTLDR